jgi:solute carrier family 35 protein F1/2
MYPVQISNDTKYQTFDQNGMAIIQLSPACDKEMTTAQSDAPVDANLLDNDRQEIGNSTMAFKKFYSLYMGQVLSLLVTMTGVCTTILGRSSGFAAPTTQNIPNYVVISLFLGCSVRRASRPDASNFQAVRTNEEPAVPEAVVGIASGSEAVMTGTISTTSSDRKGKSATQDEPPPEEDTWWKYLLLSFVDVEANVLSVWAYEYTSITSAMMLDCFTIPSVMVLSCIFLGAQYTYRHFLGAGLCLIGVCIIVLSDAVDSASAEDDDTDDADEKGKSRYSKAWLGDMLCISGAFLYSVSNVTQERWVRSSGGPPRFLGRLGLCGILVSTLQAAALERNAVFQQTNWRGGKPSGAVPALAWIGYTAALSSAYVVASWFLVSADAALFNLSLLTSDIYAVVFSYFLDGRLVSWMYFLAFAFTLCGLYLYHTAPPPTLRPRLQGEYTSTNRSYSPSSNFGETDVHSVLHGEEDKEDGGLDLGSGPAVI